MEKRYTAKVPASIAQRLYEAGMPLKVNTEYEVNKFTNKVDKKLDIEPPSYAKTLDWFASKGIFASVYPYPVFDGKDTFSEWDARILKEGDSDSYYPDPMHEPVSTWQEAAEYGINKALELLTDGTKTD